MRASYNAVSGTSQSRWSSLSAMKRAWPFDTGLEQSPGSPLVVWSLHCETHQLWYLDRRQKGTISIRSAKTGLVLAADRRVGNGTWVTMQEWSSKPWQRWFIRPSDEPRTVSIVSAVTDTGPK